MWARRQTAFHHQFDIVYGTSLWVVTSGNDNIKKRIQRLLPEKQFPVGCGFGTESECLKTSLAVHLEYCHWSTVPWGGAYMQWLEVQIENLVSHSVTWHGLCSRVD